MNRLLTAALAAAALWAAACSGGGSTVQPPPPTGNFTNASLNGTYAFVTNGEVITSTTETALARTGSFSADSHGNITGGVYDVVSAGGGGTTPSLPNQITGGSYTVSPDGRGTLTLNVNANGIATSISFAFVLTSGSSGPPSIASDGLMIDETVSSSQASTGSGNFILQNTGAFAVSNISGPYVFDFSGLDSTGSTPESLVGQFAATTGAITTGFEDSNDGGALSNGAIGGNFNANISASGRGTATIAGQTYAFYIVDSNRLRLIASNATATGPMLTGDVVSQSAGLTSPTGDFAFIVAGSDLNISNGLVRVGRFTVSGTTVSKILMDVNDAGSENTLTNLANGTVTSFDAATGRGTLSFSNPTTTYSFVFYLSSPSDAVIQEVTRSGTSAIVVADGSLAAQSGKPFAGSNITGPYAINWSGQVTAGGTSVQDEEDLLGQVKVSSLNLSGTADYFQFTGFTLFTDQGASGSINFNGGDGAGDDGKSVTMTVKIGGNAQITMATYIVNPQLAFFVNTNASGAVRTVAGILRAQQ